ncbi:PfkB family carbohydrate kinase [Actinomadura vinacea]|uniref:PfkB family carbohydrate kinase n=1 Tax=Actinomadura vinacea TaxID=115336 RepID=A0ABN3IKZ9_9ACTN
MSGRLVHTGQVIVDLVMRVRDVPEPGGDVLASSTELLTGGGFNVMSAAARSGARVVYAGAHGTGRFGDQIRASLRDEGIAIASPPLADGDTGLCVALVDKTGERTFVTGTGAEGRMRPEQLAAIDVRPDDLVYLSGYSLLHESNRAALRAWLPTLGQSRVLLDPGPLAAQIDADTLTEILPSVDVLSCNATEAHALTGLAESASAAAALRARLGPGAATIVRTGPSGCVLSTSDTTRTIPGSPVTPVDTNGAGDTHCGVLAATLLAAADLETAAHRANAAAAFSVLRSGPATAPTASELDRFLAERT